MPMKVRIVQSDERQIQEGPLRDCEAIHDHGFLGNPASGSPATHWSLVRVKIVCPIEPS